MKKVVKEYQTKSIKELDTEEKKLRDEITRAALENNAKQVKDTNVIAKKKKRLAVVLTLRTLKTEMESLKDKEEVKSSAKKNG